MSDRRTPLLRGPVFLHVGGRRFVVGWRPAAEWASIDSVTDVFGFLDAADRDVVGRMLLEGSVDPAELVEAAHRVLTQVTGRIWWEGERLLAMSVQPETLGHLTLAGVDPWERSAYEWCAAVYALHTRNADDKARARFDFQLSLAPKGYEDLWGDTGDGGEDPEAVQAALTSWMGG